MDRDPRTGPSHLPDLIISAVGPRVVETMAKALDEVIGANVHHDRCVPFDCDAICPTKIAIDAVRQIALLSNLAVVAR